MIGAAVYSADDYRRVARMTGVSEYKLRRAIDEQILTELTAAAVEEWQAKLELDNDLPVTRERLLFDTRMTYAELLELEAVGAVLPDANGRYMRSDVVHQHPHRFAVLPPHPVHFYKPVRPTKNYKHYRNYTAENFYAALERKRGICPDWYGEHNSEDGGRKDNKRQGWFQLPDGLYDKGKYERATETMNVTYVANPPLYAADFPLTEGGHAERIIINGYTSLRATVVNLTVIDDWGVAARSHGIKHHKLAAYHECLHEALQGLGLYAPRCLTWADEIKRLIDWLNSAKKED